MRLLLALLALAACTSPASDAADGAASDAPAVSEPMPADDLEARAAAAGLSPAQTAQFADFAHAVLVPVLPDGWTLYNAEAIDDGMEGPYYQLEYQHEDTRCFSLFGATDGLGGPGFPKNSRAVAIEALPLMGTVPHMYWVTDDPEDLEMWGPDVLTTDYLEADGITITFSSHSDEGCTVITPDIAQPIIESLRFLDPEDDRTDEYRLLEGESTVPEDAENDPEALARAEFAARGNSENPATVEVLRRTDQRAVVLVTNTGLFDDSIEGERIRAVYHYRPNYDGNGGMEWMLVEAAAQYRCYEGRGHQDWSPEYCL